MTIDYEGLRFAIPTIRSISYESRSDWFSAALNECANALEAARFEGMLGVVALDARPAPTRRWLVDAPQVCDRSTHARFSASDVDATLVTTGDGLASVLDGTVSPFRLLANGQLRFVGDYRKLMHAISILTGQDGQVIPAPCEQTGGNHV